MKEPNVHIKKTTILVAINTKNHKVLLYLCQRYPLLLNLKKPVHTKEPLLIIVIKMGCFHTFRFLISQLKKPPEFTNDTESPNLFIEAIVQTRPAIVRYLFNKYKDLITHSSNEDALLVAGYFSNLNMIKLLIELGYDYKALSICKRFMSDACKKANNGRRINVMMVAIQIEVGETS